jgi:hypothetical protein
VMGLFGQMMQQQQFLVSQLGQAMDRVLEVHSTSLESMSRELAQERERSARLQSEVLTAHRQEIDAIHSAEAKVATVRLESREREIEDLRSAQAQATQRARRLAKEKKARQQEEHERIMAQLERLREIDPEAADDVRGAGDPLRAQVGMAVKGVIEQVVRSIAGGSVIGPPGGVEGTPNPSPMGAEGIGGVMAQMGGAGTLPPTQAAMLLRLMPAEDRRALLTAIAHQDPAFAQDVVDQLLDAVDQVAGSGSPDKGGQA